MGEKNWNIIMAQLEKEGLIKDRKNDLKNPISMRRLIEIWYSPPDDIKSYLERTERHELRTLENIVQKITNITQ